MPVEKLCLYLSDEHKMGLKSFRELKLWQFIRTYYAK